MATTGPGQQVGAESLEGFFARTPKLAVAFSGGTDSAFLVAAAMAAGCDVRAYCVRIAFLPPSEMDDARRMADGLGAPLTVIDADVFGQEEVCANGPRRCFFCKTFIFSLIREAMARDGFEVLADGTNASDDPERRPGFQALADLGVASPLRRAGMAKDDVRRASRELGLFTADKPSFSCLAVHAPAGARLTSQAIAEVSEHLRR